MKGILNAPVLISSLFTLFVTSVLIISISSSDVSASDDFGVYFEEQSALDHVCFLIDVENSRLSDFEGGMDFTLNESSVDMTKVETRLWEEETYTSYTTVCESCEYEICTENNETKAKDCKYRNVTSCEICGARQEPFLKNMWIEKAEERNVKTKGVDVKSDFEEVSIGRGEEKRYKLCYYFNEIPRNPSTGGFGSYGYMYLNLDDMLYYDFENSSWWNESYMYRRDILGSCNACSGNVTMPVLINDTNFRLWTDSDDQYVWCNFTVLNYNATIGYLYYNDEADYVCVNAINSGTVFTDVDEGNSSDSGSWEKNALVVAHLKNTNESSIYARTLYDHSTTPRLGKIGYGRDFGTNKYITIADSDDFNSSTGLSVMAWVYLDSFLDTHNYIIGKEFGTSYSFMLEFYNPSFEYGGRFHTRGVYGEANAFAPKDFFNTGQWYFVAGTYNGSVVIMYSDGVPIASTYSSLGNVYDSSAEVCIGCASPYYTPSRFWNGIIDEVRIYNRSLSSDEIMAIYKNTEGTHNFSYLGTQAELGQNASESTGRYAIEEGIKHQDALGLEAVIYTDQQIYTRYEGETPQNGSFDKITVDGNQTWCFNYHTGGGDHAYTGMSNISNVFYVWEDENMTITNIEAAVSGLINLTNV